MAHTHLHLVLTLLCMCVSTKTTIIIITITWATMITVCIYMAQQHHMPMLILMLMLMLTRGLVLPEVGGITRICQREVVYLSAPAGPAPAPVQPQSLSIIGTSHLPSLFPPSAQSATDYSIGQSFLRFYANDQTKRLLVDLFRQCEGEGVFYRQVSLHAMDISRRIAIDEWVGGVS